MQNVRGLAFLEIIGINSSDLTRNVIILSCLYVGLLLVAGALMHLRMPRPKKLEVAAAAVAPASAKPGSGDLV